MSTTSTVFYVTGNLLGLRDGTTNVDITPSGTLKLYGTFRDDDITSDTEEYGRIPGQFHIAIAYKVLAMIDLNKYALYEKQYYDIVRQAVRYKNRLSEKRRIKQYDY